jgi:ATP-binding cassette, subfamily B, bacterial
VRDVWRGSWAMIGTAWRISRIKIVLSVVLTMAGAAAAPLVAAALGWMTDDVVAGNRSDAIMAGILVPVLAMVALTFQHFAHIAYFELSELAELDFDEELLALSNGSKGIAHHEQAEFSDMLTVLQQESRRFRMSLEALLNGMGLGLAMILTAILLARESPLLLLLPIAAVPPLVAGRAAEKILNRAKTESAEQTRLALNLFHLSTSAEAAAELRVFRLQNEMTRRHTELWNTATARLWRAHVAATWIRGAGQVIFALAYVGAVLLVIRDAIVGQRGVGDVVLVVALAAQVNQQVTTAVALLQDLQRMASTYRRLSEIRAVVAVIDTIPVDQATPDRLWEGITLDAVAFTYPGTETPVLRDVNLTLPAGSTVAIVGENGAGKSTLVKLLCGFYQPSAGRILVDGADLRAIPVDGWRGRIAAGFQDFIQYEFLARETVGLGDLPRIDDEPAVNTALDRANAAGVADHLAEGMDTQLGKSFADGVELSGGQWQKLALGRAMMRDEPLLLVLDEPTSALDPEAEHALFERYAAQAKRVGRETGAITLFVSHRFSTVRMADLIIVVQDGRVVEAGDHAALVGGSGLYSELFAIQAAAYR